MSMTTRLCWVLRDLLGMTGTKFGCGMALCGACTVHVNGRSAARPARRTVESASASAPITTIEAVVRTPIGHSRFRQPGSI